MELIEEGFLNTVTSVESALIASISTTVNSPSEITVGVNLAFEKTGAKRTINKAIAKSAVDGINVGRGGTALGQELIEDTKEVYDFVLTTTYGRRKPQLYKTLKEPEYVEVVIDELEKQYQQNATWIERAKAIKENTIADLPKAVRNLINESRRAGGNVDKYRKQLREYTRGLALDNASQGRLRKAYENIIKATEQGTIEAMDRAVKRAVSEKMRYNAERISRTESFFGYGQSVQENAVADDDIGAMSFDLDATHKIIDVCNTYASANLYGLGAGVYPKEYAPTLPIHPNGRSTVNLVEKFEVDGEGAKFDPNAMESYIKNHPKHQEALLGKKGKAEFKQDPNSWKKNLRNWEQPTKFVKRIPQ